MMDIALTLLRRFWPAIPIIGLAVALMLTRNTLGNVKHDRDAWKAAHAQLQSDTRGKTAEAKAADAANVIRVERAQSSVSQETDRDYQAQLAALRRRYDALRLRTGAAQANPGGGGGAPMPGVPSPAGRADAAAAQDGLPPEDALIASEQALQLEALQSWVRGQAAVER
jgi:hypothetical protein